MAELAREDIQGLVISSYIHLPCAAYMLLGITDPAKARRWLGSISHEITTAQRKQEGTSINIAFTYPGLEKLGLDQNALQTFSRPFIEGMATEYRARILGDRGESAPEHWIWGNANSDRADGDHANPVVDILLLLFAEDEPMLAALIEQRRAAFVASGGIAEVMLLEAGRQPTTQEHFGFNDGIGQPVIAGSDKKARQKERTNHATELPAGEFLMGYINDYNVTAEGPFVEPDRDPQNLLPTIPPHTKSLYDPSGKHDLGRNGTYLVFRQMAQHVADFWQFLDAATRRPDDSSDPEARTRLGAKFVGRWPSGAPLVMFPDHDPCPPGQLTNENNFGYAESDTSGFACPIGSHVRRANPRDSVGPDPKTARESANRHRLMRRGRSYGTRQADPLVDDGVERGLHFICLNSDIERQFEFVQLTWLNNPTFGGLYSEVDPVIGHLDRSDGVMTVQAEPLRTRVHNLRRFITIRGGAYFFLPGIKALNYLAALTSQPTNPA